MKKATATLTKGLAGEFNVSFGSFKLFVQSFVTAPDAALVPRLRHWLFSDLIVQQMFSNNLLTHYKSYDKNR